MSNPNANTVASMEPGKIKRIGLYVVGGALVVIVLIYAIHFWRLHSERARLEAEAKAGPRVQVVHATHSPGDRTLNLVGEARPFASVTLYAKVSGYLKSMNVDKGDKVKEGQLLAVIESPEIDKDYNGARADARNKKAIADRMNLLRERQLVSPQEADQANSDAEIAQSKFEALAVQKSYETLRAPFAGTVTARFADAGALVQNAANSQTSALPLVTVAQVDKLRVYVYVDQRDAAYIKVGSPAKVTLSERTDLKLEATVSRVSGELDQKTKMLLTEIDLDKGNGQVVPGSFVNVSVDVHAPVSLQLPAQALVMQEGKTTVPVLDGDDRLHFKSVTVGENSGQQVDVLSGITDADRVVLNAGTNIPDGSHVRPMEEKKPDAPEKKADTPSSGPAPVAAPVKSEAATETPAAPQAPGK